MDIRILQLKEIVSSIHVIQQQINRVYKVTLAYRMKMNKHRRYTFQWLKYQSMYAKSFQLLESLEGKKKILLKGGHEMAKELKKGSRKARAKGQDPIQDPGHSIDTEKLSQSVTTQLEEIEKAETGVNNTPTTSPRILKKKKVRKASTKKKAAKKTKGKKVAKMKNGNGQKRMEKKAAELKELTRTHGSQMKKLYSKNSKVQEVVRAMEKNHGLTQAQTYQILNVLGVISTKNAQRKLEKMKAAGLL